MGEFPERDQARIIRWVSEKLGFTTKAPAVLSNDKFSDTDTEDTFEIDPRVELKTAIRKGDLSRIYQLLPKLRELEAKDALFASAVVLSVGGVREGAELLLELIDSYDLSDEQIRHAYGSLVQYYNVRDDALAGIQLLESRMYALGKEGKATKDRAFYLNQLGRLYYGAKQFEKCLEVQKEAADLVPEEIAYQYNTSLVLQQMGMLNEALKYAKRTLSLQPTDPDHIETAIEIFSKSGLNTQADLALDQLREISPDRAKRFLTEHRELLSRRSSVKSLLRGWGGAES
ncbi:MAG: hypothetical protein KDG55_02715 [Rhodocyclaceae bacterium]|nr:hypothetical protein [Rhodocyclaceae bacterium]